MRNQISITGLTGVGSTSLVEGLKRELAKLPYRFVSGGGIMRAKAAELGMMIEEFAAHNRNHPEDGYDLACDNMIGHFATHDYIVCDGRLPHHFMPEAFHVVLICDPFIRAERRQADSAFRHLTYQQVLAKIKARDEDDNTRYVMLYGEECLWPAHKYNLVVDTESTSKADVVEQVLQGFATWQNQAASV